MDFLMSIMQYILYGNATPFLRSLSLVFILVFRDCVYDFLVVVYAYDDGPLKMLRTIV
jgi:hypothetical protein